MGCFYVVNITDLYLLCFDFAKNAVIYLKLKGMYVYRFVSSSLDVFADYRKRRVNSEIHEGTDSKVRNSYVDCMEEVRRSLNSEFIHPTL